jgi:hypothetical protein
LLERLATVVFEELPLLVEVGVVPPLLRALLPVLAISAATPTLDWVVRATLT